jgi:anti-sigma-K factor RskA
VDALAAECITKVQHHARRRSTQRLWHRLQYWDWACAVSTSIVHCMHPSSLAHLHAAVYECNWVM